MGLKFDGYHCPKCGKSVRLKGGFYKCRCGWSYSLKESNFVKRLLELGYTQL